MRADGARGQPGHWNGADWPCPRHLTETTARPADLCVGPRFNQPLAWAMKSAWLAIVSPCRSAMTGRGPRWGGFRWRWMSARSFGRAVEPFTSEKPLRQPERLLVRLLRRPLPLKKGTLGIAPQ